MTTSERIEPGAQAAHRDDLARDVARLWAQLGRDDISLVGDAVDTAAMRVALDRLAEAYGLRS